MGNILVCVTFAQDVTTLPMSYKQDLKVWMDQEFQWIPLEAVTSRTGPTTCVAIPGIAHLRSLDKSLSDLKSFMLMYGKTNTVL